MELDFNYNYFRDIPTFDPTLIGTGLLDKFLFQGFSAGGAVEVLKQIWVSANMGRSSRTGDAKSSLNQMYGITFGRVPWLGLRVDAHYARFNSSFGSGSYEALSVVTTTQRRLRIEVLAGQQNFTSPLTTNDHSRFVTGNVETSSRSSLLSSGQLHHESRQLELRPVHVLASATASIRKGTENDARKAI